jgi:hypothetical protein
MSDLIGKQVECHDMPSSSFYVAVSGIVEDVKGDWATVRATQVMDRWSVLWEKHPTSCLTSVLIANLEMA